MDFHVSACTHVLHCPCPFCGFAGRACPYSLRVRDWIAPFSSVFQAAFSQAFTVAFCICVLYVSPHVHAPSSFATQLVACHVTSSMDVGWNMCLVSYSSWVGLLGTSSQLGWLYFVTYITLFVCTLRLHSWAQSLPQYLTCALCFLHFPPLTSLISTANYARMATFLFPLFVLFCCTRWHTSCARCFFAWRQCISFPCA